MAIVGLSEFTFGYGFLYEQTLHHWDNLRAAPILPSLAQEADDAWDARLPTAGTDFYYQFKLSDYLVRPHSMFHKEGIYKDPYYRVAFHRRDNNRQHHRLWLLAKKNQDTYYVAPEFNSIDTFTTAFLNHRVADHSRIIPLNECDDCRDGDQHYLTFRSGDKKWIQHSERKPRDRSFHGTEIERLYRRSNDRWQPIDRKFAVGAFVRAAEAASEALRHERSEWPYDRNIVEPLLQRDFDAESTGSILRAAGGLLCAFFGATMVLVGEPHK